MASDFPTAGASGPPAPLVKALSKLLRPLVRVLVAYGITFPYLAGMLKGVYVDVVDNDFPLEGKKQTVSRISLMSGVHRKDVRRLLEERSDDTGPPKAVSVGARLVSIWTGSADYLDENGKPKPLPRSATTDGSPSFDSVVESINRKDVRSRAVLDEFMRLGIVHIDDDDFVHLNAEAFVPRAGFEELAYYFGRNVRDHIEACAHNIAGSDDPFPERAVYFDRLSKRSVDELRQLARETAVDALSKVNKAALELADRDENAEDAHHRMTLGVYYYSEDEDDGAPEN